MADNDKDAALLLDRARRSLNFYDILKEDKYDLSYEDLGIFAHQAAELALKALLRHFKAEPSKTQNLTILLEEASRHVGIGGDKELSALKGLNAYSAENRGSASQVSKSDVMRAFKAADHCLTWVKGQMGPGGA
jgi:HEPN domain-containing protein